MISQSPLDSIAIIVPALNEEKDIEATVDNILSSFSHLDLEVIIVNDASYDRTKSICERLAKENQNLKLINHDRNLGLGAAYESGLLSATNKYVMMLPGDNEISAASVAGAVNLIGAADLIICYPENYKLRKPHRIILSKVFTTIANLISKQKISYYNGPVIINRELLHQCVPVDRSFAYQIKIITLLVSSGCSYVEWPFELQPSINSKTSAFGIRNIVNVARAMLHLWMFRLTKDKVWLTDRS
jgi:dolichol-phosphate mannosyltransferase